MSDAASVEQLLKMEPKVECTGDSMKLQVQGASTSGSLVFVDRGAQLSPLPVSKLPPSCGYSLRSTRRDLVLVAPYDGCFVSLEEDNYVLPLLWLGIAVRMSCPSVRPPSPNPPMVTCHAEGMMVKVDWAITAAKIKVNLNGTWESLMKASSMCRFGVVEYPEGVVISVHYKPCLQDRGGIYTLELAGEGQCKISCPSLSPAPFDPAKNPSQSTDSSTHPSKPLPSNPTEPPVPQVPSLLQNPDIPNQGPKDTYQPQLPYIPYPNLYYPYMNPDPAPTVNPTPPPYPYYVKQTTHPPAPRPEQKPATAPPLVQTNDQRWQYFYPFYPPQSETPPKEPPVQKPPPDQVKQPFLPNPFDHLTWPPKEPVKQDRPQYPAFYPPLPATETPKTESPPSQYPKNPEPLLPEEPKPPASGKDVYQQFYPYNIFQGPYQMPGPILHPAPTAAPKGQGQHFTTLVQPGTTKPADVPGTGAPQPQLPQQPVYPPFFPNPDNQPSPHPGASHDQIKLPYNPFYQWPGPKNQPTQKPPQQETPPVQVGYPSYPQPGPPGQAPVPYPLPDPGETYQPFYPFYQPEKSTPVPKPTSTDAPKGQGRDPYLQQPQIPLVGTNDDKTPTKPVQQPSPVTPPHSQVPFHFNPFYSQQPWNPPAATVPPVTSVQVTTPASGQQPPQAPYCSAVCPPGFPGCCLQIAFHQHLHHIVPPGDKDTSPVYPGFPFIPSLIPQLVYSGYTSPPKVPSTSAPSSPQFPSTGSEEQPYLPPPGGNPATFPGSSPSKPAFPKQLHQFVANPQYPSWPYPPQNVKLPNPPQNVKVPDPPQTQQKQQFFYRVPSNLPQSLGNELQNPQVQYGQVSSPNPNRQDDKSSAGGMNNPTRSNYFAFMTQNLPKQQNKRTANKQQPNKDSSMSEPMLQDAQVPPNRSMAPNNSTQLQQSGLKEHGVNTHSTKSFVLLRHGPPGRKPTPLQLSRLWKGISRVKSR
ncbi:uncharacterized protein V6R79_000479 [Siganus canaliculatus]